MVNINQIIQDCGGDKPLALACGLKPQNISNWRAIGRIPPKHWPTIVEQTKESRTPISYEDLAEHQRAGTV